MKRDIPNSMGRQVLANRGYSSTYTKAMVKPQGVADNLG